MKVDYYKIKLKDKGRRIFIKRQLKGVDIEFWEDIDLQDLDDDLKEAIEEYVRDCDDISKWVD